MNQVDIPEEVQQALQIYADLDGFGGTIPGHLHLPSFLNTRQGLWTLFTSACYGLFVLLVMFSSRSHTMSLELMKSGGGPTRTLKRGADTTFHISPTRCSFDGASWAWTDILFVRLVPPAVHSTGCTLQVFERGGPEHRWVFGADNYKEILWVVSRIQQHVRGNRSAHLPDALQDLLRQAGH